MGGLASAASPLQADSAAVETGITALVTGDELVGSLDGCTLWETRLSCQRAEALPVVSKLEGALAIARLAEVTDRKVKPKANTYINFFTTDFL